MCCYLYGPLRVCIGYFVITESLAFENSRPLSMLLTVLLGGTQSLPEVTFRDIEMLPCFGGADLLHDSILSIMYFDLTAFLCQNSFACTWRGSTNSIG